MILSICVIVAIVLTAYIIHSIFSESPLEFEYKHSSELGGVILTKYTGQDLDVILPSEIEQNPVVGIEGKFAQGVVNNQVRTVIIPDSIVSIGDNAFFNCDSLTSVTIPDSVVTIGSNAFLGCRSLTSITIPENVTSIGTAAFNTCRSLTSITIPNNVPSLGFGVFASCNSLTSVFIPESVTSIGNSAFAGCSSLESVTIPDSVTSLGNIAFLRCPLLPEQVKQRIVQINPDGL